MMEYNGSSNVLQGSSVRVEFMNCCGSGSNDGTRQRERERNANPSTQGSTITNINTCN